MDKTDTDTAAVGAARWMRLALTLDDGMREGERHRKRSTEREAQTQTQTTKAAGLRCVETSSTHAHTSLPFPSRLGAGDGLLARHSPDTLKQHRATEAKGAGARWVNAQQQLAGVCVYPGSTCRFRVQKGVLSLDGQQIRCGGGQLECLFGFSPQMPKMTEQPRSARPPDVRPVLIRPTAFGRRVFCISSPFGSSTPTNDDP